MISATHYIKCRRKSSVVQKIVEHKAIGGESLSELIRTTKQIVETTSRKTEKCLPLIDVIRGRNWPQISAVFPVQVDTVLMSCSSVTL